MDQLEARKKEKQELERLRAEKKEAEAAARRKKDIEKIKKNAERKAKVEVYETLQREGAFRDSDTRSDPGRARLPYDTLARQVQDTMLYMDDRRGREPDHILEDIYQVIENRRRRGGWRSYSGSIRSSPDGASTKRVETVPRAYYDVKTDPNFRKEVQEVVMDLLWNFNVGEKEEDRLPLPPVPARAASDDYPASEGHRRTRQREPNPPRPKMPVTPPMSQDTVYGYEEQEPLQDFSRSTDRRERRPASSRKLGEYPRKPQATRNEGGIPNTNQSAGPNLDDSGYSSQKNAQSGVMIDHGNNVRRDRKGGDPTSSRNMEEQERTQGRMYNQAKPKKWPGYGNQEAYEGILLTSDSEDSSALAHRNGDTRSPAPYGPVPSVPDAPYSR
jgi:hypothetical protein